MLRKLETSDADFLARLWSDPLVTEFEGGAREYATIEQAMLDEARAGQPVALDMWTLVEKATNDLIGHCGLIPKDIEGKSEVEIVYTLACVAWGKGYATEIAGSLRDYAASALQQSRLIALIHPGNVASERVAQKIGMRLEREVVRPSGAVRRIYVWEAN